MPSHANPVNWFEIPVSDLGRAKTFYEKVLGVEIAETEMGPNKMGWFPMEMGAAGATGRARPRGRLQAFLRGDIGVHARGTRSIPHSKRSTAPEVRLWSREPALANTASLPISKDVEGNRVALHGIAEASPLRRQRSTRRLLNY